MKKLENITELQKERIKGLAYSKNRVNSSNIEYCQVTTDGRNTYLIVGFHRGGKYAYRMSIQEAIKHSTVLSGGFTSPGKYWNSQKNNYPFIKID
jgi:hypothetical protein